jgi:hypothetical protein
MTIDIVVQVVYTQPQLVNKTPQELSDIIVKKLKFPQPRKQSINVDSEGQVLRFGWITEVHKASIWYFTPELLPLMLIQPFLNMMKQKFGTSPLTPLNLALLHM